MSEMTTTEVRSRRVRLTGPVAFVWAWVFCTLAATAWVLLDIARGTSTDSGTAALVALAGTTAVACAATAGALLRRRAAWRPAGAVVLAVLAIATIPFLAGSPPCPPTWGSRPPGSADPWTRPPPCPAAPHGSPGSSASPSPCSPRCCSPEACCSR